MPNCPRCNKEIESLDEERIQKTYRTLRINDNSLESEGEIQSARFYCPLCNSQLFGDEDSATEFLSGGKKGYRKINRESEIDNLICWIAENTSRSEKEMMKDDLAMLLSWTCKNIYSSENTNEYLEIKD